MATIEAPYPPALETELLQEVRSSRPRGMPARERLVAWTTAGLFLVGATALAAAGGSMPSLPTLVLLVVLYAALSRVGFEIGAGWAMPTQLVFVPMLFVLPPAIVPLCVAAALVLAGAPEVIRGGLHPHRLLLRIVSATHALGPAIILTVFAPGPPAARFWPFYVAALAAQFAADYVSTAPYAWSAYALAPLAYLRQMSWSCFVDSALSPIAMIVAVASVADPVAVLGVVPLVGLLAFFARERQVRIDHALELSKAYRGTALLLGDVIEADDAYTGAHSHDVVDLVLLVADKLGLVGGARRDAEFAALLHDVGKVRVPTEIINKPGPLDDAEWEIMKTHTIEGERMLEKIGGLLGRVGRIVRSCHERWDGNGYPDRLAGTKIPLIARIVMCCDAYSAMTTDRAYRQAMTPEAAADELRRCSGTHFDPKVVNALLEALAEGRR